MEANPGTVESQRFADYVKAGITRISIGSQSFQPEKLSALGVFMMKIRRLKPNWPRV